MKHLIILVSVFCLSVSVVFGKERSVADVVETASKAIVNIRTEEWSKASSESKKINMIKRIFTEEEDTGGGVFENIGSGVVVDPKGIIVTNEHLISKAIDIRIRFINGKEYEAHVLGSNPEHDIALLKITDTGEFPYLKSLRKKDIRVGEMAIVIGNPYGLSSSVSVGVVSALRRNLRIDDRVYVNLIQTDAAINPGNSGGALLDMEGNPLGIITAIYGEGKGIGFAIPIQDVMNMLSEFIDEDIKKVMLGLFFDNARDEKGSFYYVSNILRGSPAEKYGIKIGDRIVEFNRQKVKEGIKLHSIIRSVKFQKVVQLKIIRGTKPSIINIDMKEISGYKPSPIDENLCGLRVADIRGYPKLKFKLREKEGIVVTKVYKGGIAEKCGLRTGDVIIKINNNQVKNRDDFDALMLEGLKRNYILYQVKRNDEIFFIPVKFDMLL